jgi:ribosomal protein S27E
MVKCPVCFADQVAFIVGPQRTNCYECRASWVQLDGQQTAIDHSELRLAPPPDAQGAALT